MSGHFTFNPTQFVVCAIGMALVIVGYFARLFPLVLIGLVVTSARPDPANTTTYRWKLW